MQDELIRQAEEKRLQALPPWKRQLMQNKKHDEKYVFKQNKMPILHYYQYTKIILRYILRLYYSFSMYFSSWYYRRIH